MRAADEPRKSKLNSYFTVKAGRRSQKEASGFVLLDANWGESSEEGGNQMKAAGEMLKNSPSAFAFALLIPRFPLTTSETMPFEPKISARSACLRSVAAINSRWWEGRKTGGRASSEAETVASAASGRSEAPAVKALNNEAITGTGK